VPGTSSIHRSRSPSRRTVAAFPSGLWTILEIPRYSSPSPLKFRHCLSHSRNRTPRTHPETERSQTTNDAAWGLIFSEREHYSNRIAIERMLPSLLQYDGWTALRDAMPAGRHRKPASGPPIVLLHSHILISRPGNSRSTRSPPRP
jgi:hypothetical protein